MLDIKSELLAIQKQREQDFISIIELLDFLKALNPTVDYSEIAIFLLIKLEPHDVRKANEELWGDEAFEAWEWEHGIKTYRMPASISDKPISIYGSYFFTALEAVRDDKRNASFLEYLATAEDYLGDDQKDIYIDRVKIENILGISTLDKEALDNKYQNEIKVAVGMALTQTEEFVRNTDINKSPVGLAERLVMQQQIAELQARIAELEAENQNLKKTEPPTENYNPTERETHLQIIAMQSFELAKLKSSYLTGTGKVRQSTIATTLEKEAKELFANPKSSDTYRKRIAEALKTYETQAE